MRLDNRPLLGTQIDEPYFVEPPAFAALQRAVRRRLNVLLLGAPGAGKTTLLRHLADEHRGEVAGRACYVDLATARTAGDVLALLESALALSSTPREPAGGDDGNALLRSVRRLGEQSRRLLLLDGPPGGGASYALFGSLRDALWELGHQWVVAANTALRDELTRPPAGAFFDVRVELAPLPVPLQRELLLRRVEDNELTPGAIDALVGETDGLPRSVISLAREAALSETGVEAVLERRRKFDELIAGLPRAARGFVDYLASYGPASASDPDLLAALATSPQRARLVLGQLEQAGIARSFSEQLERRGRPRKLYELAEGG